MVFVWGAIMDKVSNQMLFSVILSSQILTPYQENEPELAVLLENPYHCNIHYPQTYATVDQIIPTLRRMLDYMLLRKIYLNMDATRQLIAFGEKYPDSQIYDITFNCDRRHYGVCCGQTEAELRAICVMTGDHIPDEMFGELNQ
jgi:hypothetical protein